MELGGLIVMALMFLLLAGVFCYWMLRCVVGLVATLGRVWRGEDLD